MCQNRKNASVLFDNMVLYPNSFMTIINPTEWTLRLTKRNILWNVTAERYIIYLALRNNYIVYVDDESGYISFDK